MAHTRYAKSNLSAAFNIIIIGIIGNYCTHFTFYFPFPQEHLQLRWNIVGSMVSWPFSSLHCIIVKFPFPIDHMAGQADMASVLMLYSEVGDHWLIDVKTSSSHCSWNMPEKLVKRRCPPHLFHAVTDCYLSDCPSHGSLGWTQQKLHLKLVKDCLLVRFHHCLSNVRIHWGQPAVKPIY